MNNPNQDDAGLLSILTEISFLLEALVKISIPSSNNVNLTGEQKTVYELCNLTNSIQDIAQALEKSESQIRKTLIRLKRKGLVIPVNRGKKAYYCRRPVKETSSIESA